LVAISLVLLSMLFLAALAAIPDLLAFTALTVAILTTFRLAVAAGTLRALLLHAG
jgi:hypothetical protein